MNKNELIWLLLVVLSLAFFSSSCSSSKESFNRKASYEVTFIIQKGYFDNKEQLDSLNEIINKLPVNKKANVKKMIFYNCELNDYAEFDGKEKVVVAKENIFGKQEPSKNCEYNDLQSWFDCCLKSYSLTKKFYDVFIFSSVQGNMVREIQVFPEEYQVYYDINELIQSVKKSLNLNKKDKANLLVLHYFNDVDVCDTISNYLIKNNAKTKPIIYQPVKGIKLRRKDYGDYGSSFELRWSKIDVFDEYEIFLRGYLKGEIEKMDLKFIVTIDPNKKGNQSNPYLDGDIVVYNLNEDILGEMCLEQYDPESFNDDPNCECKYDCIYERIWQIKIRGIACDEYYGQTAEINGASLQCPLE